MTVAVVRVCSFVFAVGFFILWVFERWTEADILFVVLDDVHCRHCVHAGFVCVRLS